MRGGLPTSKSSARRSALIGGSLVLLALAACEGEPQPTKPDAPRTLWGTTGKPSMPEPPAADADLDSPLLAEAERKRLAEIENRVLILSSRSLPALAERLVARDRAGLRAILTDEFAAVCLVAGRAHKTDAAFFTNLTRSDDPGAETFEADGDRFVSYLLDLRETLGDACRAGFAVRGLSPNGEFAGAWSGACRLRMSGERGAGEPAEVVIEMEFEAARIAPSDEARDALGWLSRVRVLECTQGWARAPLMEEVAAERGLDVAGLHDNWTADGGGGVSTGGVYTADLDDDGRLDIVVNDVTGLTIYRGLPAGRFENVTDAAGLPPSVNPNTCVLLADLDGDTRVDVVLGQQVFANAGGMRFLDVTNDAHLPLGAANGATVADFDRDGKIDVYATYGARAGARRETWFGGDAAPNNQLWKNKGRWGFENVAPRVGAAAGKGSTFTSAWLDADVDGRPDVYVISEFGPGVLLLNQPDGTFREHYLESDDGDFGSMGLAVGDYDNDGHVDIFTANMYSKAGRRIVENLSAGTYPPSVLRRIKRFVTGSELYRNVGDGSFERKALAYRIHDVGWSYAPSFVDLDNDGFLDLYATAGFMSRTRGEPDG